MRKIETATAPEVTIPRQSLEWASNRIMLRLTSPLIKVADSELPCAEMDALKLNRAFGTIEDFQGRPRVGNIDSSVYVDFLRGALVEGGEQNGIRSAVRATYHALDTAGSSLRIVDAWHDTDQAAVDGSLWITDAQRKMENVANPANAYFEQIMTEAVELEYRALIARTV